MATPSPLPCRNMSGRPRLHITHSPSHSNTHRERAIVVPIRALKHRARLLHRPLESDRSERGAIPEGRGPYARHAVSAGDRGERVAIIEGIIPYARHAVGNGDRGQAAASVEGIIIYASPSSDYDFFQRSGNIVVIVVIPRCAEYISKVRVFSSVSLCSSDKRQGYAFKRTTTKEGRAPYARHAVPYGDGGQASATVEGIFPYARHAVRDGNGGQTRAIAEGTFV